MEVATAIRRGVGLTLAVTSLKELDELVGAELDVDQAKAPVRVGDAEGLPKAEDAFIEGQAAVDVADAQGDVVEAHRADAPSGAVRLAHSAQLYQARRRRAQDQMGQTSQTGQTGSGVVLLHRHLR